MIEQNKNNKGNSEYSFNRNIYRLQYQNQIRPLFDNPKKIKEKANKYFGEIGGIEVRIDFSMVSSCSLNAKTQEDLGITYRKIVSSLIKN